MKNGDREKFPGGLNGGGGGGQWPSGVESPDCLDGELERLRSELRLATAALVTSQEMERKRMASELHDSVGQELNALSFGIRLAIDQLRKGALAELGTTLETLSGQVRGTIEETRRIALDLRPAMLDDLGVIGTLSWFFRQVRTLHPCLDLQVRIDAEERDVPEALRTPIYRVIQEATSNVVKHSGATEVRVTLHASRKKVELGVTDNGSGFSMSPDLAEGRTAHSSCGLAGMRNRVEFSGGEFAIGSKPAKGTSIKATWPLCGKTTERKGG